MVRLECNECKICGKTFSSRGLAQHIPRVHDLLLKDYIIKYYFNNQTPKCKCGCGEDITIRGYQIMDYKNFHADVAVRNLSEIRNTETWLEKVRTGIIKYNKEAKLKNPDYRKGKNLGIKRSEDQRAKMREITKNRIKNGGHFIGDYRKIQRSSLEIKFEEYLKSKNILFEENYIIPFMDIDNYVKRRYYDFYIPEINTLIEIHGSYWHPKKDENLSDLRKKNFYNDIFKRKLAKDNRYWIMTIYDYELDQFINENCLPKFIKQFKNETIDIIKIGYNKSSSVIRLPNYWDWLVDEDSVTVQLTPIGKPMSLFVIEQNNKTVKVGGVEGNYNYTIYGTRKDVPDLVVETEE